MFEILAQQVPLDLTSTVAFKVLAAFLQLILLPLVGWVGHRIARLERALAETRENYISKAEMREYMNLIVSPIQSELKAVWGNGAIGSIRGQVAELSDRVARVEERCGQCSRQNP